MDFLVCSVLIGTIATAVIDVWAVARTRLFGVPRLNYGLVGRWFAYLPRGRFYHEPISATPSVRGEHVIGWMAHYITGIVFAAILLAVAGIEWARHPTIGPALIMGFGSVAAPFLLMQPGMGAGIAASRTPRPCAVRFQNLVTHGIFGVGLYSAAWLASQLHQI